ncbi:MAG: VOC family protein [Chloroflexota bacterium]
MHIKSIAHMGLIVRDVEKSRWFYGAVLEMPELTRPEQFQFDGAWFQGGDSEIHLIAGDHTTAPVGFEDPGDALKTGLATHLAFEIDDLEALVERLNAHNIEIKGGPMKRGDGAMQMYLRDPDGYTIEFFQWVGEEAAGGPPREPFTG